MSYELQAIEELSRKAGRQSKLIGGAIIGGSFLTGLLLFLVATEIEAELTGYVAPKITFGLTMGLSLAAGIALARIISNALIRARRTRWIAEAATKHGVPVSALSEALLHWE